MENIPWMSWAQFVMHSSACLLMHTLPVPCIYKCAVCLPVTWNSSVICLELCHFVHMCIGKLKPIAGNCFISFNC